MTHRIKINKNPVFIVLLGVPLVMVLPAFAAGPFAKWLDGVRTEALARGIRPRTISEALDGLTPDPRVIGFDRNQPEFVQTFDEYLAARVSRDRVREGRRLYHENNDALMRVGRKYGVAPKYLVAFWGLESSFGRYQGNYSVIRSLATLAHDERRSAFFREELMGALRILDQGHTTRENMVGGWAGAMGQSQFMPSGFLEYAEDFDGDGIKDIWGDPQDVWASIANYLAKNGWRTDEGWGLRVQIPPDFDDSLQELREKNPAPGCRALASHTRKITVARWQALGVRRAGGGDLPVSKLPADIIIPENGERESYLTFPNFRAILSYNCANKYAVSVGIMADLLES